MPGALSAAHNIDILSWLEKWARETPEKPVFITAQADACITYGQLLPK